MYVYSCSRHRHADTLTSVNSCEWRQSCSFSCLVCGFALSFDKCQCTIILCQLGAPSPLTSLSSSLSYSSSHGDTLKHALTLSFSFRSSLHADTLQQFSANTAVLWNKANVQRTLMDPLPITCTWLGEMTSCAAMPK